MAILSSIRAGLVVTAAACTTAAAQIPPSAPTAQAAPRRSANPADQPAQRADVRYSTGLLTVSADNSSLNQILRDVGRATGMKITGGVNDERVYGSYGPADLSTVLGDLLRGTGSNMLLVVDGRQSELVLTPRGGGPTPPSPNAGRGRDDEDLPPQRMPHTPRQDGAGFQPQGNQPPQPQFNPPQPPQPTSPTQFQIPPQAPTAPSNDTTTQQSPNGVPTPQQIYDQLMKLHEQKQAAPATPPQ